MIALVKLQPKLEGQNVSSVVCRDAPPLIPTETSKGYKATKAKLGSSRVRPWMWMPFQNPARKVNTTILVIT